MFLKSVDWMFVYVKPKLRVRNQLLRIIFQINARENLSEKNICKEFIDFIHKLKTKHVAIHKPCRQLRGVCQMSTLYYNLI